MSELRNNMIRDMELRGFSPRTQQAYLRHVKGYVNYYKKSPEKLGGEEIKNYLHHIIYGRKLSRTYSVQAYSALKFLYATTMKYQWEGFKIPSIKIKRRLPTVLTLDEVRRIFNVTINLKHRAILVTIYSAGLRVSEAVNLKVKDVDSKSMRIFVDSGKGNKDRYTILSKQNLSILQRYYRLYRPSTHLFYGFNSDKAISVRSIQKILERSIKKAGITKKATVHTLRHTFATHMIEDGIDVYHIQKLMGHGCIKTTTRYIHVSDASATKIESPLDKLDLDEECLV